jgi:hypothetical protein
MAINRLLIKLELSKVIIPQLLTEAAKRGLDKVKSKKEKGKIKEQKNTLCPRRRVFIFICLSSISTDQNGL